MIFRMVALGASFGGLVWFYYTIYGGDCQDTLLDLAKSKEADSVDEYFVNSQSKCNSSKGLHLQ